MAANLYARSIFGEDALANVSIEKPIHLGPDAPVTGHIRIRAKSQVIVFCIHPNSCNPVNFKAILLFDSSLLLNIYLLTRNLVVFAFLYQGREGPGKSSWM